MISSDKLPKRSGTGLLYLLVIALILASLYLVLSPAGSKTEEVNLNSFVEQVRKGQVESVEVASNQLNIVLIDGTHEFAIKESGQTLADILDQVTEADRQKIKEIKVVDTGKNDFWTNMLIGTVPFLIIIGFFLFMMRQAQSSSNQALSFGLSKARLFDGTKKKTTFKDVAGAEEAKEELVEIVDFLKSPTKYTGMGAKIPKGVLLVGPAGTGKTLLARAVAGEANVPFFNISGSEFVEMFVGVGASRVRDLFKKAKRNAPCIIFIDEIDAVGRQRGAGLGGGHDEREQTLNQILSEMDGFETETNIVVMAATNRPDVLDPALLRPGRFDRKVVVDLPDILDREAILKVHSRGKPLAKNINFKKVSQHTPGFSGADLENLMNEAAILAAKNNRKEVSEEDVEKSMEKVVMGPERKSRVLNPHEKKVVAYHESGHAIISHLLPHCDPVHKVSIISRGMALGVTWAMPEEDKHLYSKSKFENDLSSMLGGYVAEKLMFGEVTTGASNDLERVTMIARKMVTDFGMSTLGPIIYGEKSHEVFLGRDFMHSKNYSEEVAANIDKEIRSIIDKAYAIAEKLLNHHKDVLNKIASALMKKETINAKEFEKLMGVKKVRIEVEEEAEE